jgi:hypothetical protein
MFFRFAPCVEFDVMRLHLASQEKILRLHGIVTGKINFSKAARETQKTPYGVLCWFIGWMIDIQLKLC